MNEYLKCDLVIGNMLVCELYIIKVDGLCTSLGWKKKLLPTFNNNNNNMINNFRIWDKSYCVGSFGMWSSVMLYGWGKRSL